MSGTHAGDPRIAAAAEAPRPPEPGPGDTPAFRAPPGETLVVDASPAYDLLLSLVALAQPARFDRWRPWARRTLETLPDAERQRIRRWFGGTFGPGAAPLLLVPLLPSPHDVPSLLAGIAALPIADFMRVVIAAQISDASAPVTSAGLLALRDDAAAAAGFLDTFLRGIPARHRAQLLRLFADPEGARAELLVTLRHHAEHAFARLEPELAPERERALARLREIAFAGPRAHAVYPYADLLTGVDRLRGFTPAVLAASAIREGSTLTYFHEMAHPLLDGTAFEPAIFVLSARRLISETLRLERTPCAAATAMLPSPPSAADAAERLAKVHALLGDPTRLRLLRLLAERPHFGQELAAALDVTGATVSHHAALLAAAGLVALERDAQRTYFVLQPAALAAALDESADYLAADTKREE